MREIVGILLAAGAGSRFGRPKLLQPLPDGTLVGVAAARCLVQAVPNSVAVIRPGDLHLAQRLAETGLKVIENPQVDRGMGSSLAAGIHAAAEADGWLIALADMPWVQPATIQSLVERMQQGASIVAPTYQGRRGHPVGFASPWREKLLELSADIGAKSLITAHPDELQTITTQDPGVCRDVDYPTHLAPRA